MEVVVVESADAGGELVGGAVADLVSERPGVVIGLATGSSPLPVYGDVARRGVDLSRATAFLLDEYVGLPPGHTASYRAFIARELEAATPVGRVEAPDVHAADLPAACAAYDASIAAAGGVDLQLLGIGGDGHIGFNEPGSSLASRTRVKTLTERTRRDNARFFGSLDEVPRHVVTQGVGTILDARHLVLLAFGRGKSAAVAAAVEGPVTAMCPASALQLHPHVTVVVDEPAASRLSLLDYYRETWAAKPAWQRI